MLWQEGALHITLQCPLLASAGVWEVSSTSPSCEKERRAARCELPSGVWSSYKEEHTQSKRLLKAWLFWGPFVSCKFCNSQASSVSLSSSGIRWGGKKPQQIPFLSLLQQRPDRKAAQTPASPPFSSLEPYRVL